MSKLLLLFILTLSTFASERIIALSPSINEIVFALGKGDTIVGNTDYCKFPIESVDIQKVGGYFSPSLEKILSLNPTLVIMQQNNYALNKKLKALGIKTLVVKIDKLLNIKNAILSIGKHLDATKKAKEIVENIDAELENIKGIVKDKKILFVIGHNTSLTSRVFVVGQNLYFNEIIEISGNTNAFQSKRKGQPILNMENIIATDADIVILLAHSIEELKLTKEQLINPWLKLPIGAAKTKSVYIIDKEYAGIPSDRIILFLRDYQKILNSQK